MKKYVLTLLITLAAMPLLAQRTPHALGVHLGGSTLDIEYQYHFNKKNFVDVTVGSFDVPHGFMIQGTYNWNLKEFEDWSPNFATWKVWAGAGVGIGGYGTHDYSGLMLGPVGDLRFGFTINSVPITLGIDYRPMVAIALGTHSGLVDNGFFNLGITATYRF